MLWLGLMSAEYCLVISWECGGFDFSPFQCVWLKQMYSRICLEFKSTFYFYVWAQWGMFLQENRMTLVTEWQERISQLSYWISFNAAPFNNWGQLQDSGCKIRHQLCCSKRRHLRCWNLAPIKIAEGTQRAKQHLWSERHSWRFGRRPASGHCQMPICFHSCCFTHWLSPLFNAILNIDTTPN